MIHDFNYVRATTVKEALEFLDEYRDDYKIICGGQSLLILMRQGLVAPQYLIDIKRVEELNYIKFDAEEGLRIGATTTHRSIEFSPVVKKHYPVLVDMEENLASRQTRNWGTIGGNLAHGEPAGDPAPVLISLDATITCANKERQRALPLEEFSVDYFETQLEESEMVIEVQVPVMPPKTAAVYEKFNIIKNDQGVVSVAARVTLEDDGATCKDVRLVLGGSAPIPLRVQDAEPMLIGTRLDDGLLEEVAQKVSESAEPVSDIQGTEAYRRRLIRAITKRNLKRAWEQAASQV
jgi:carbon-monoxide dehydrogenase medium subunit